MTPTLNTADPKACILAHDKRVKLLDGKTTAVLHSIYLSAIGAADMAWGGPRSHDELVNAVIEIEFPQISAARQAYAQSVAGV